MEIQLLFIATAAMFVIVGGAVVVGHFFRLGKKKFKSPYVKRTDFFEPGEFKLFATLLEVCSGQCLVLPHVHLGRVLDIKKNVDWKDVSNYRSRIDRKPADFMICSKEGKALAVVDVGSDRHNFPDKKVHNNFLDDLAQVEGLPLVTLSPGMNADAVRGELKKVIPDL